MGLEEFRWSEVIQFVDHMIPLLMWNNWHWFLWTYTIKDGRFLFIKDFHCNWTSFNNASNSSVIWVSNVSNMCKLPTLYWKYYFRESQNVCKRPAITILKQICNPLSTEIQCEIRVVLWQWPGFCQPVSYIRCCFINKSFPKKEKYSDVPKKKNIGISQLNRLKRRAFERAEEAKKEEKLQ